MNATEAITEQTLNMSRSNGHSKARVGYPLPGFLLWITIVKIWAVVGFLVYLYGEFLHQNSDIFYEVMYPDIFTTTNLIPLGFYFLLIALSVWWTITADPRGWGLMLYFCVSEIVSSLIGIWLFPPFYQFLEAIGHTWAQYPMADLMMAVFVPLIVVDLIFMCYYFSGGVMRYFGVGDKSRFKAFVVLVFVSLVVNACIIVLTDTVFGFEMMQLGYESTEINIEMLLQKLKPQ